MKARDVLQRYAAGERDFRGANLRGLSFQGKCLAGADFSEADIHGTDFTGADLTGVKFCGARAGLQNWFVTLCLVVNLGIVLLVGIYVNIHVRESDLKIHISSLYIFVLWLPIIIFFVSLYLLRQKAYKSVELLRIFQFIDSGSSLFCVFFCFMLSSWLLDSEKITLRSWRLISLFLGMSFVSLIIHRVSCEFSLYILPGTRTRFCGSRLINVDFTDARLYFCDFRNLRNGRYIRYTEFLRTRFRRAWFYSSLNEHYQNADDFKQMLDSNVNRLIFDPESCCEKNFFKAYLWGASLQGANLQNANLEQADLRKADLRNANLQNANFRRTDLSQADLTDAKLQNANLTQALAIGTNFTKTKLTGACLEAWNIDSTTIFKNVDCQYIYLREHPDDLGSRERRPHDPTKVFAPGDFEHLYTQLMHTVEILLRGGMNRDAFAAAFQKISEENPEITWDSIQSIEKKGEDVLLTLEVPPDTDKAQVEQIFDAAYVEQLKAQVEAQTLRAQDMKDIAQDMKDIALALANKEQNITASNVNQSFRAPVTGVSGKVEGDQIIQPQGEQFNLQTLIAQLQTGNLSDDDRKALVQLKILFESSNIDDE